MFQNPDTDGQKHQDNRGTYTVFYIYYYKQKKEVTGYLGTADRGQKCYRRYQSNRLFNSSEDLYLF